MKSMRLKDLLDLPVLRQFSKKKIKKHPCEDMVFEEDLVGGKEYKLKENEKGRYTFLQYILKDTVGCPYMNRCNKIPGLSGPSWANLTKVPIWPYCPIAVAFFLRDKKKKQK